MELNEILESLKKGNLSIPKAKKLLSLYSIEKIEGFAQIDIGRRKRRGIPEVVYGEGKQIEEIKKIILRILKKSNVVVISRLNKKSYSSIVTFSKKNKIRVEKGKNSTTLLLYKNPIKKNRGKIGIITAGTSDIGVAEEARLMCEAMNCLCICNYDVGIAGLQRIFPVLKKLIEQDVDVVIVVAGMEGALASIVSSLVNLPVIGVPTSVGYGYGEKGIAALASMLQSCALGLAVVNIDNGIGAGAVACNIASRINHKVNE